MNEATILSMTLEGKYDPRLAELDNLLERIPAQVMQSDLVSTIVSLSRAIKHEDNESRKEKLFSQVQLLQELHRFFVSLENPVRA